MTTASQELGERFEQNLVIAAPPARVFDCFFAPDALRAWWQAVRSVTTPSPFGVYAIEWATTPYRDDLLGPLGGVFHGTVVDVKIGQQFLVADSWRVPPGGRPGRSDGASPRELPTHWTGTRLSPVRQDGCEPSPRWRRYYAVASRGWQVSLTSLKRYLENSAAPAIKRGRDCPHIQQPATSTLQRRENKDLRPNMGAQRDRTRSRSLAASGEPEGEGTRPGRTGRGLAARSEQVLPRQSRGTRRGS